jgi:hypothetical protein
MAKKDKKNMTYWVIAIIVIIIIAILLYYGPKASPEEAEKEGAEESTEITEESAPQYSEAEGYLWGIVCDPATGELSFKVTNAGDFKLNLYHGEIPAVQPLMKVSVNGRTVKEDACDRYILDAGATASCSYKPAVIRVGEADYDQYGLNKLTAISVEARETETFACG